MKIAIATPRPLELEAFLLGLSEAGAETHTVLTGADALELAKTQPPDLMVVDGLPDIDPLPLVSKLMAANAMVNTAVLMDMDPDEFHEESEGLGILMQLPLAPTADKAKELAELLRGIIG